MTWNDSEPTVEDYIIEIVEPAGSMALESIVNELTQHHDLTEREAKLAVTDAVHDELLVEHPEFDGAYIINDESESELST